MTNSEIWSRAADLFSTQGHGGKRFALRQAVAEKWNGNGELAADWVIVASRVGTIASLH